MAGRSLKITLGPVPYLWDGEAWRDFYFRIADCAWIDAVTLGEVVCSKRLHFTQPFIDAVATRLAAAGKEVVLASMAMVTLEREAMLTRKLVQASPWPVEANDLSALGLLSGRSHRVFSGVCMITPSGKVREKLVETRVRFKRLSREELESYLASGQWRGKAGGYAVQGLAGSFVVKLVGSYTNVVGLPLYETVNLLVGDGYRVHLSWLSGTQPA